tara:strand:- start:29034 stop:29828 length:795 start_codon:yes stop_codon:yes gene_type:complete
MDSDTPNHPTSRRVIRKLGNEGFGALVRLWCFAAQYGKGEVAGRCIDSDGDAIAVEDLVDASGLASEQFGELVSVLLETKCIDAEAWESRQEMAFPGMTQRADSYTKKLQKNSMVRGQTLFAHSSDKIPNSANKIQKSVPTVQDSTEDHSTREHERYTLMSQWWNEITASPIPRCNGTNAKRKVACRRVMDEFNEESVRKAFGMVNASKFCRGENERGWKASFDWILRPDSILRTLEGKYADRQRAGTTRSQHGKYDNVERGAS